MMKIIASVCAAFLVFFIYSSCRVVNNPCAYDLDPNIKAPDSEIVRLDNYISSNNITATKHSSGLYYQVLSPGNGANPGQCDMVGVTYKGKLTDGKGFDSSSTTVFFSLNNLILGWRVGLPLVKAGGSIRLYVPPDFGYGQNVVGSIPKNSILIFDVNLNEVK